MDSPPSAANYISLFLGCCRPEKVGNQTGTTVLHAIAELNRASHCIAANSDCFEVFAVSIVMMS